MAEHEANERHQAKAARDAYRQKMEAQAEIDQRVDKLVAQVEDLVTAAMLISGYHTHKRQWRKWRKSKK